MSRGSLRDAIRSTGRGVLLGVVFSGAATGGEVGIEERYRSGEERGWVFEQDGKRIGWHLFRYEGDVGALGTPIHRFTGRVEIDAMPQAGLPRQRYAAELFTDGDGHPLRQVLEAELGGTYSRVDLSISAGKGAAEVVQGTVTRKLVIDVPGAVFAQANSFVGYFELMLAEVPLEDGTIRASLLSSNALQVFPYQAKSVGEPEAGEDGRAPGSKLEDSLGQVIDVSSEGRVLEITIPGQKLRIVPSDESFEAFSIERPVAEEKAPPFDVESVEIRHGEVVLAGEITRPRGSSGRLPAVFFLSGSGLQDRDGLSSGIDLGTHEILDRLTLEGMLVLRVDDRGAGESRGPVEGLRFDDLIADGRACVDHLLARDDVDPDRVALIGHSEGGCTAPILAAERPRIAALVLMAATGRPIGEVILEQNAQALDLAGIQGEGRERILADVRRYLELASSDAELAPEDVPADYRELLAVRPWLQSHARQDPLANLRKLRCPILILQGAKDFQVSPDRDARAIVAALDESDHPDHELVLLPDLDHLFKRAKGEKSHLAEYFEQRPVDAGFLDALSDWLMARLRVERH